MDDLLLATARAEARHFWFRGFKHFVTPLVEQATQGLSDARLLDCGCGTGANVDFLSRYGQAWGFDLNAAGLRIGRALNRTRLARASVTEVPFPSEAFDVVTSFDVLYALDDEQERTAVSEMFRVLKPGGYLVLNVAAMDVLRGDHSILGQERRRYTRARLRRVLSDAGFTVLRLTHTNTTLFPLMLVTRTYQRWRGLREADQNGGEIHPPPAPVNSALAGLLRLESYWLRAFDSPIGSSVLCLARKR